MEKDASQYVFLADGERRELFQKLQELILKLYPKAEMKVHYTMLRFAVESGFVYLNYWKEGVTLDIGEGQHLQKFKAKYPRYKIGKCSVSLKARGELPWQDIENLIRYGMEKR